MGTKRVTCGVVAFAFVALACKTNVTDDTPLPPISSNVLGKSTNVAAILVDDTSLTWLNLDGSIDSCSKTGCQPRSIATSYESLGTTSFAWWDSQAVVAQGVVYFIDAAGSLQSCPLGGCSRPTVIDAATFGTRIVTDGNWLAYLRRIPGGDQAALMICSLPSCVSPSMVTGVGANQFALADGVLFYIPTTGSIDYCRVGTDGGGCPSGVTTAWQSPEQGGTAPLSAIVGANAGAGGNAAVFVTGGTSGELMRCDLPTCPNLVDMGAAVNAGTMAQFSGTDIYMGAVGYGRGGSPSSWMHCTQDQCDPGPIPYPDPVLAGFCAPADAQAERFGDFPFAVDATNFYWATDSMYQSAGNFIVSTAR